MEPVEEDTMLRSNAALDTADPRHCTHFVATKRYFCGNAAACLLRQVEADRREPADLGLGERVQMVRCPATQAATAAGPGARADNYETGERSPHGMLETNTPVETMRSGPVRLEPSLCGACPAAAALTARAFPVRRA